MANFNSAGLQLTSFNRKTLIDRSRSVIKLELKNKFYDLDKAFYSIILLKILYASRESVKIIFKSYPAHRFSVSNKAFIQCVMRVSFVANGRPFFDRLRDN